MTEFNVPSTATTVRSGYLDPGAGAVATVASGDTVVYADTWTHWGNEAVFGMSFAEREPFRHRYPDGPYSMIGPVVVDGAEPGDVVRCDLVELRTIGWGWNSFPLGVGALPSDFEQPYLHYFTFDDARTSTEFVDDIRLPLAPFLGVVAVEPAGDEKTSAILSGPYGGNLVLKDATVGTSLYLPVQKPGARLWLGDVHALQGDGVVDQTAIETAAEVVRMRYTLHKGVRLQGPLLETPHSWTLIGFASTLDDAIVTCLRQTIDWLATATGMDRRDAYALCSMAVSFRVTQFAVQTGSAYSSIPPRAIHAVIPKAVLSPPVRHAVGRWLRGGQEGATNG
jgi:acetamidase/formamidase